MRGVKKEVIRIHSVNGTNTFVGINNSTPTATQDIYNTSATAYIMTLWNTTGSVMCLVSNTGLLSLAPSGTSNVMTIGGTLYSCATVQAAFALPSTPVVNVAAPLSPTGSNTVLTVGGTHYSASTVQAAFALPSTPLFTGNISLPTLSVAPTGSQLGYMYSYIGA